MLADASAVAVAVVERCCTPAQSICSSCSCNCCCIQFSFFCQPYCHVRFTHALSLYVSTVSLFRIQNKMKKKLSSECYFFFNFHRIQMQSYSFSVLNKEKRHLHALFVNIPTKVKIAFFFRELIVIGTCISSLVSSIAFNSNRLVFQYIHIILMFFLSTS